MHSELFQGSRVQTRQSTGPVCVYVCVIAICVHMLRNVCISK